MEIETEKETLLKKKGESLQNFGRQNPLSTDNANEPLPLIG